MKLLTTALICIGLVLAWACLAPRQGTAEEPSKYVGPDTCLKCHKKMAKTWMFTVHRRTLFNSDPSKKGCEACHGPGGDHVAGGGDPTKIVRPEKLKPTEMTAICLRCHTQEHVTLWPTSRHARAKLTCLNCHDPHGEDPQVLSKDIENGKLQLAGLTRGIEAAELSYNTAPANSKEKDEAGARVAELKAQRDKLLDELKGQTTLFERSTEPYICYNCHPDKKAQANLPSHHPINEGKVVCTDCHNPHGGPQGMLREESVPETCFRCHAEKVGPFVYDHPPVTEDCTICHNPHGSVNNNLLTQNQTFLCLKCHFGPHSGSSTATAPGFATRYAGNCTNCHNQIHGSNVKKTFTN